MGGCGDCAVWSRVICVAAGIAALVMSALVATSCEYVGLSPGDEVTQLEFFNVNATGGTVGLFKLQREGANCRKWDSDEKDDFDFQMNTARWATVASVGFGVIGLVLVWTEFACCRFGCSRFLISLCYVCALIGVGLSGLVYASDTCQNPNERLGGGSYPCEIDTGTIYAIVAFSLYFFTNIMICVTPKPEPMCKRLAKQEETDPCCPCFRKVDKKEETFDEEEEEEGDGEEEEEEVNVEDENTEEEPEEEKKPRFMFWKKDKKKEEPEQAPRADEEVSSVPSNYHDSVAEEDEIPRAVMVGGDNFFSQRSFAEAAIIEEEGGLEESATRNAWPSPFYFWPKKEPEVPAAKVEPDTKDLFFDAQITERDVEGGKGAEVF